MTKPSDKNLISRKPSDINCAPSKLYDMNKSVEKNHSGNCMVKAENSQDLKKIGSPRRLCHTIETKKITEKSDVAEDVSCSSGLSSIDEIVIDDEDETYSVERSTNW